MYENNKFVIYVVDNHILIHKTHVCIYNYTKLIYVAITVLFKFNVYY